MKDDRIDFSSLDPSRDPARWERVVAGVAARAAAARRAGVAVQLRAWARPALAMATALAIAVWTATLLRPRPTPTAAPTRGSDGAAGVVAWASSGDVPADVADVLEVIDGR